MTSLVNLVKVSTATTGTGTITLGTAVSGFLTMSQAGAVSGVEYSYGISDGANSEVGTGTNSNALVSLSGSATVYITPLAADFATVREVTVDFGSTGGYSKEFTLTDAAALTTHRVFAVAAAKSPPGGYHDELEMDPIAVFGRVQSSGQVILKVVSTSRGKLYNKRIINYQLL
jgi:hypothetical protein